VWIRRLLIHRLWTTVAWPSPRTHGQVHHIHPIVAMLRTAGVEKVITSDRFQTPTTVARFGRRLAVVNAKFDTGFPPTADQYEGGRGQPVTGRRLRHGSHSLS